MQDEKTAQLDAEFKRVAGLIGENYLKLKDARKAIKDLTKQRAALLAEFQAHAAQAREPRPVESKGAESGNA